MSGSSSQQGGNTDARKVDVQRYFSRTAEGYVASNLHRTGDDLLRLIDLGEWSKEQRALDIATGGGHTARTIAPYVGEVVVTDLTPAMLERARASLQSQGVRNARYQIADAELLPFPADSFDRVTCRIAPHHFPNVARAVKEVSRVLTSGGIYLLIDCISPDDSELDHFNNHIEKWRDPSHGRAYTAKEWIAFFTQAGLRVEAAEIFHKRRHYRDWTQLAQLPTMEQAALEHFILSSNNSIQRYFDVRRDEGGHLASFRSDYLLLKGRKNW